jgi:hypothetical protein
MTLAVILALGSAFASSASGMGVRAATVPRDISPSAPAERTLMLATTTSVITGQVVAAYRQVRLTSQDFGGLASGPF